MIRRVATAWREAWSDASVEIIATAVVVAVCSVAFSHVVTFVDARPGVVLVDPVLEYLPRADVTWFVFGAIYVSVVVGLLALLPHPGSVLLTLRLFAGMLVVRMAALYLLPLEPPPTMITLEDPIAHVVFGVTSSPTRDLFFSGHTATVFIVVLSARTPPMRALFAVATATVGLLVLVQRCHYTVDVFAAPLFVLAVDYVVRNLTRVPPEPQSPADSPHSISN